MEITKKIKPIGDLLKVHRDLLEKLGFSGSEPYKDKFITDLIDQIDKGSFDLNLENLAKWDHKKIFSEFMKITKLHTDIHQADDIFKTYEQTKTFSASVSLSVSSSYTQDVEETSRALSNNITGLDNYIRNAELNKLFADAISNTESDIKITQKTIDNVADIYLSFVKKNNGKYVIDLYTATLEITLQKIVGMKNSRELVLGIGDLLEKIKDEILDTPEYESMMKSINMKNTKVNSVQFLVQKHALTPATEIIPIEQILKKIGISKVSGNAISSKLENASKLLSGKKQKYGFVVIYKIVEKGFRHTLDPLISETYINNRGIMTTAMEGISKKTIDRTSTIQPLTVSKESIGKDRVDIFNSQFSNSSENFYYILQSLNGNEFEILTPWGFGDDRLDVSENFINFKDPVSSRVGKYNCILDSEIYKNLSEPMTPPLGNIIEMKLEDSYWNGVIGKIKNNIIPRIRTLLEKKSDMTSARFTTLLSSPDFLGIIFSQIRQFAMDDMTKNMKKLPTDPIIIDQFNDEMNITFAQSLDQIIRKLPKRMMGIWKEELEPVMIKKMGKSWKSSSHNVIRSMEFINKLLTDTLRIYINRKSGIFISIRNKIDLIEKTLLQE